MIHVRPMRPADIAGVVNLQRACFPAPFPEELLWRAEHIAAHLGQFAEGQFVAVDAEDQVWASATNMRLNQSTWDAHPDWETKTGGLALPHHSPDGAVLFGVDISVHPKMRRQGLARSLYQARFDLVGREGIARYATVCRLPGFATSGYESVRAYAEAVAQGHASDATLTPLLRMGLTFVGVQTDYMDDVESGHAGARLEWKR